MAGRMLHRLSEVQVRNARPTETVLSMSERTFQSIQRTAKEHPGFSRAEPLIKGAVVRDDGKVVKRKTRWLCDGGGLWLVVSPGDDPDFVRRSWIFRYTMFGRQRRMGLGSANGVLTLAEVRERARLARVQVLDGIDPLTAKRSKAGQAKVAELHLKTFDVVMAEFLMKKGASDGWSAVHSHNWSQSMRDWISPVIGNVALADIDTAAAIRALSGVWEKHPVTAARIRGRCEQVWDFGALLGYVTNTAGCPFRWRGHLEHRFTPMTRVEHLPALPYKDVAKFVKRLREVNTTIASRAAEFTIRTACRTGEVLKSKVSDVDRERQLLVIPKANTKNKVEHIVPLTDATMALLELDGRADDERLFSIHTAAMLIVVKELNPRIVLHSFRSTFRDFAADCTEFPREIAEACLGHADGSRVELSYRRTTFLEKRTRLMQAWSDYIDGVAESAAANNIIPLRA